HGQLTCVCHGIGEWSLEKLLRLNATQFRVAFKMSSQVHEHFVQTRDFVRKRRQRRRAVSTTNKTCAGITQHTGHVPNEFSGRPNVRSGAKLTEFSGGIAQRFLSSVSNSSKKMAQHRPLVIHVRKIPNSGRIVRSGNADGWS